MDGTTVILYNLMVKFVWGVGSAHDKITCLNCNDCAIPSRSNCHPETMMSSRNYGTIVDQVSIPPTSSYGVYNANS